MTHEDLLKMFPGYVWGFVSEQVKVKHGLKPGHGEFTSAECNAGPVWHSAHGWLGVAGRPAEEVAKLQELRPCKRCLDRLFGKKKQP
jgi:hypothetical protein